MADCNHPLSDPDLARVTDDGGRKRVLSLDSKYRYVGPGIRPEHRGFETGLVVQRDANAFRPVDHMVIGENEAPLIKDDSTTRGLPDTL